MKKRSFFPLLLIMVTILAGCSFFEANDIYEPGQGFIPVTGRPDYSGLDYKDGEVLVRVDSLEGLANIVCGLESKVIKTFEPLGWAKISVPSGMSVLEFIDELEDSNTFLAAEPNLEWELPLPEQDLCHRGTELGINYDDVWADHYDKLWGMKNIKADKAWEKTTGDEKVIIAILDTGLDLDHPEFIGHEIIAPFNATDDKSPRGAKDVQGHGTHVAGTAAANGRYNMLAGVAWDCPIMPVRTMNVSHQILSEYLADAVIYVADFVKENPEYRVVMNMSIGGRGYSYLFKDAIDYAFEAGVLLVTSNGNDHRRVIKFPSNYNGVVSVAAVDPNGIRASFSTTGPWTSVAAPGVKIWSSYPLYIPDTPEDPYVYLQGTSMASPHVCGAAALLLSQNPSLTPLEIKNQLEETARPGAYGEGFTEELGYGIVDVEALLGPLAPMKYGSLEVHTEIVGGRVTVFNEAGNIAYFGVTGSNATHNFYAMLSGKYTVTLSHGGEICSREEVTINAGETETIRLLTE